MPSEFRPLPLLGNAHLQTIIGNLWKGAEPQLPARQYLVPLPDGDRLLVHDNVPIDWKPGDRIALLVHGLGGTHRSGYMVRMLKLLVPKGWRVVRMDLRGCGTGMAYARKPYNGGCSADVRAVLEEIGRWSSTSPLVLIGFSLGGNIVLKLAGESVTDPVPNLEKVAAVSPPVDLEKCAAILAQWRNRFYEQYYVRGLLAQVRQRQAIFPDDAAVRFPRRMTMRLFDDLYTAPRCGYNDALDYYRRASAWSLLPRIEVSSLILTARDDPFVAVEPFESFSPPPGMTVSIMARGGHLGFLGWDGSGGIRWAERRIADWIGGAKPGNQNGNG
jgi:uncharacterized protein